MIEVDLEVEWHGDFLNATALKTPTTKTSLISSAKDNASDTLPDNSTDLVSLSSCKASKKAKRRVVTGSNNLFMQEF